MQKFHTHIEALRGLAILLVILYHLVPEYCQSGYYGVDIFLMISGYLLIAGLLKNDGKDFSLLNFIKKKTLRIFPPLLLMVIPMLGVSLWVMAAEELQVAAKTAFYSLWGYSNVFLDLETLGYFAGNARFNPFLHTWYLSVILQVYCLFALVTMVLRPYSRKLKWMAYLCLGVGSVCVIAYYKFLLPSLRPHEGIEGMYFWTWGRVIQVVVGGGVLLLPTIRWRVARSLLIPLGMLILLYYCFSPGKNAAIIMLAGILLLWGKSDCWLGRVLDNKLFRFLGKYSFSLYLWHWPIIVYACYVIENPSIGKNVVILVAFTVVGIIAWYLTERKRWKLWSILLVWGLGLSLTYYVMTDDRVSKKLHPEVYACSDIDKPLFCSELCPDYPDYGYKLWVYSSHVLPEHRGQKVLFRLGKSSEKASFILIGDSHASAFMPGMAEIAQKLDISGYYLPVYTTPFHNRMCGRKFFRFDADKAQALMEWLTLHPEIQTVVLAQRWSIRLSSELGDEAMPLHYDGSEVKKEYLYENTELALSAFCENLKNIGKQVVIMTEVPSVRIHPYPHVKRALLHNHTIELDKLTCTSDYYYHHHGRNLDTFEKLERAGLCRVLPIHRSLLGAGTFRAYENGQIHMTDSNHISALGAILYARRNYKEWRPLLSPPVEH